MLEEKRHRIGLPIHRPIRKTQLFRDLVIPRRVWGITDRYYNRWWVY